MSSSICIAIPFIVYMIAMMAIGVFTFKSTSSVEGFALGERKLHPWVAAMSYVFSGCSGWMFMGAAGISYIMGPGAWWMLLGYMIGVLFSFLTIPMRLRNYSGYLGAITYPGFFVKRVRDNTNLIRGICSLALIVFIVPYIAAQYSACIKGITSLFDVTPLAALLFSVAVVTIYCMLGGFKAVCLTDYIQGWVILAGGVLISVILVSKAGGWGSMLATLKEIDPTLMTANLGKAGAALLGFVWYSFTTVFVVIGRPHDTIRNFAIENSKQAYEMALFGQVALLINYWTSWMIGYAGRVFFPNLADPETIFPSVLTLINPWVAGILFAALLALLMSTVDSQLLSVATTLSVDLYRGFINKEASDKKVVSLSRIAVLVVSVLGAYICYRTPQSVMWLTLYASGGLSATFGPSLILSLYWKRFNKQGAIASMLSGLLAVIIWYKTPWRATIIHEGLVGWIVGLVVGVVVSLMTEPLDQAQIDEEFAYIRQPHE